MGNTSEKNPPKCPLLSDEEQQIIEDLFKTISNSTDRLKEAKLMRYWDSQMDHKLMEFNNNFLFGPLQPKSKTTDLKRFTELYAFSIRGTIDERSGLLLCSLGYPNDEDANEISYELLLEYVEAVVSSYMLAIKDQSQYKSWQENGISLCQANIRHLAEELTYDAIGEGQQHLSRGELEHWLEQNPTFVKILKVVFTHLYNFRLEQDGGKKLELDAGSDLLPLCEDHEHKELPALIDVAQIVFINSNLPTDLESQWRFLFSSAVHGNSFSALLKKISKQGPTVLIVEDTKGHVFGGFAPASWKLGSNFVGKDTARLFSLKPKMRCFSPTGYNSHYQYLNLHQQTMPNGLGMGGQLNFWGLWLDGEFGTGVSSESCTTFEHFEQLSGSKKFEIKTMEVWAVGPVPQTDEDVDETPKDKSCLDGDPGTKTFIEMAGHDSRSDGFREPPYY